jgi:hypothetical protein
VNKIKRLEAIISRKNRDLRFNNNPEALIFRSFDQAKEQIFYFKINHFRITTNQFYLQILTPNSEYFSGLGIVGFCERTEMLDFWRKLRSRSPTKSAFKERTK